MAVGWGITDAETTPVEVADTLQEVEVPILNNCTKRYSNASMYICGGFAEGGKDSCQGMYISYFFENELFTLKILQALFYFKGILQRLVSRIGGFENSIF